MALSMVKPSAPSIGRLLSGRSSHLACSAKPWMVDVNLRKSSHPSGSAKPWMFDAISCNDDRGAQQPAEIVAV